MEITHLEAIAAHRKKRRPVALLTWLESGRSALLTKTDLASSSLAAPLSPALVDALESAFRRDRSMVVTSEAGEVFIHVFNPPLRMVIVGAVHIAQALAPMARRAGYEVIVIDPREAFATEARMPGVELLTRWPDEAMAEIAIDPRTAVVVLTHDPKIDDPALVAALEAAPFYIGALGSRRTHAKRCERLRAQGISESDLARIHAPIGLDIGAEGAVEIAHSVMAEVIATLRGRHAPALPQPE